MVTWLLYVHALYMGVLQSLQLDLPITFYRSVLRFSAYSALLHRDPILSRQQLWNSLFGGIIMTQGYYLCWYILPCV